MHPSLSVGVAWSRRTRGRARSSSSAPTRRSTSRSARQNRVTRRRHRGNSEVATSTRSRASRRNGRRARRRVQGDRDAVDLVSADERLLLIEGEGGMARRASSRASCLLAAKRELTVPSSRVQPGRPRAALQGIAALLDLLLPRGAVGDRPQSRKALDARRRRPSATSSRDSASTRRLRRRERGRAIKAAGLEGKPVALDAKPAPGESAG